MSDFRCYYMDAADSILVGEYVEAPDLQEAITKCQKIAGRTYSARVRRIEIWRRGTLLYKTAYAADRLSRSS
jgi:hypothetical protein